MLFRNPINPRPKSRDPPSWAHVRDGRFRVLQLRVRPRRRLRALAHLKEHGSTRHGRRAVLDLARIQPVRRREQLVEGALQRRHRAHLLDVDRKEAENFDCLQGRTLSFYRMNLEAVCVEVDQVGAIKEST